MIDTAGVGRVLVHAPLRLKAQRPQPLDGLTAEVHLGDVVEAQHNGIATHSLRRRVAMRFNDFASLAEIVVQHATGRRRGTSAAVGTRCAGRGRQLFCNLDQPIIKPLVTRRYHRKLFRGLPNTSTQNHIKS